MQLLDKLRVKKWLAVLLAPPDGTGQEQVQAMARLKQIGRPAIPHLLQAMAVLPDDRFRSADALRESLVALAA
jgi:hypothetical protein